MKSDLFVLLDIFELQRAEINLFILAVRQTLTMIDAFKLLNSLILSPPREKSTSESKIIFFYKIHLVQLYSLEISKENLDFSASFF